MEIRGVQGAGVLKTLLDRKLIAAAGRKNVIGKPILYKTTREFLVQFGLKDLNELPSLKEFDELARMSMAEPEPAVHPEVQPEIQQEVHRKSNQMPNPCRPKTERPNNGFGASAEDHLDRGRRLAPQSRGTDRGGAGDRERSRGDGTGFQSGSGHRSHQGEREAAARAGHTSCTSPCTSPSIASPR